MFLVLLTAFWGTKREDSLKYLTENTTKCNRFIVYKQPFHKMPVWTLIFALICTYWEMFIPTLMWFQSHHEMFSPISPPDLKKGHFVKWMSSVSAVCSQESMCILTLLIHQSIAYWVRMVVVVPSLSILDNCSHWLSSNSVSQMPESSVECTVFHRRVFYSVWETEWP